MDEQKAGILGEIALEASTERLSFLNDAGNQFTRFMDANRDRIAELGGLVLIDEDPDYLSVAEDGTFRSRTRYQDEETGEWRSETEVIESAAEVIELYNPAELYAVFAEAARSEAGFPDQPTGAEDLMESSGVARVADLDDEDDELDDEAPLIGEPRDAEDAARMLYDLALTFQERSQLKEAGLLDQFRDASAGLAKVLGDNKILDDEDERLWYRADGSFDAEVVPESNDEGAEPEWRGLTASDEMVQFYDPTDLFGDLAEALAEEYPGVAPELDDTDD